MPAINTACLKRFNDITSMFTAAFIVIIIFWRLLQQLREFRLKPVAVFPAYTQIPACLTVYPAGEIDPFFNLIRPLPIPGYIFGEMAVRLCRIVTKPAQYINPHLFGLAVFRMLFKSFQKTVFHFHTVFFDGKIPCLVIKTCTDDIQLLPVFRPENICNLHFTVNLSMTQANGPYPAILQTCPGQHGHGIRIIQKKRIRFSHFPYIPAEIQQCSNSALPIHNSADAEGIAHALIHPILKGNINICFKCLKTADSNTVDNIACIPQCFTSVCRGKDLRLNSICLKVPLTELRYHVKVFLVDIRESNFNIPQFRHMHNIRKKCSSECQTSRANYGKLKRH